MAVFFHDTPLRKPLTARGGVRRRFAVGLLVAGMSGTTGTASGQELSAPEGMDLAADSFAYDGGTRTYDFRGLRLRQGDLLLEADRATSRSLEFADDELLLSGNVRIVVGTARIESDEARLTIRDKELTTFELHGQPATFEDLEPPEGEVATGGAETLHFDNVERTLSLMQNAWLRVGSNEVTGCDLVYDVDEGTFMSGSTECDQPFRIRIARPAEDAAADDQPPSP